MQLQKWTRNTGWRQGHIIPDSAARALGLLEGDSPHPEVALVISHDCDIVEDNLDNEPSVEVIIAKVLPEAEPNHTYAKSPNKLHLEILFNGQPKFLELRPTSKKTVTKTSLAESPPDVQYEMSGNSREILQSWLALRYRRAAFPDALNKHLSVIRETMQKIGKKMPKAVIGFYIYHEPDMELADSEAPYEVWIVVVFDHKDLEAAAYAQQAAEKIKDRLTAKFKSAVGWRGIDLCNCTAASDAEFSLYDAMTFKSYPLDYISLRASDS